VAKICKIHRLNSSILQKYFIQVLGLKMTDTHSPLSNSTMTSHQITQLMNTDILI